MYTTIQRKLYLSLFITIFVFFKTNISNCKDTESIITVIPESSTDLAKIKDKKTEIKIDPITLDLINRDTPENPDINFFEKNFEDFFEDDCIVSPEEEDISEILPTCSTNNNFAELYSENFLTDTFEDVFELEDNFSEQLKQLEQSEQEEKKLEKDLEQTNLINKQESLSLSLKPQN